MPELFIRQHPLRLTSLSLTQAMAGLLGSVAPPIGEVAGIEIRVDPPSWPPLPNCPSQATITVKVPQDSNKRKVQSNEGAPRSKRQRRAGKPKSDKKQNEGILPPQSVPVLGRLCQFEEWWKRIANDPYVLSMVAKGYRLRFTSTPLLLKPPLGDTTSQGFTEDSGNARANIPNASKEPNLRGTSRYSRVLFEHIPGRWKLLEDGVQ